MVGDHGHELLTRVEDLSSDTAANHAAIDALQGRIDQASDRADVRDARVAKDRARIAELERRAEIDRSLIADLQADSLKSMEHAANLELALRSARRIGAAMGVVMTRYHVDEGRAFELLRQASMDTNRKLRDLADEVVDTGDTATVHPR